MKMKMVFALIIVLISPLVANAEILLQDNFEYAVDRNTANDALKFQTVGPWNGVKSYQNGQPGARGYLYTVSSIPGYAGSFPGQSSSRVLCAEMLPASLGAQTDAYLYYGRDTVGYLPAKVWIQFWVYPQRYGNQMSQFAAGKLLYPCVSAGGGTCSPSNLDWLVTYDQHLHDRGVDAGTGNLFIVNESPNSRLSYTGTDAMWRPNLIGPNSPASQAIIYANTWTLVRMHFDMSGASNGTWQMWTKKVGGNFVKVAEYIGGTTPNTTWNPAFRSGMTWLKVFTTLDTYDSWWYMDDFMIATSEADLPTYGGQQSTLQTPSNLRLVQ